MMDLRSIVLPLILLLLTGKCAMADVIVAGEQTQQYIPGGPSVMVDFFVTLTGIHAGGIQVLDYQVRTELTGSNAGTAAMITGVGSTVRHTQVEPLAQTTINPAGTVAFGSTINLDPAFTLINGSGLMRVDLNFTAAASGTYTLNIVTGSEVDTVLLAPDETEIAFGTQPGVVTAVPEPGSLALSMLAAGFGSCTWLRRTRLRRSRQIGS